ncbi:MAG: UDP-N-acetylmuramate--L-alanine ligase, partial [Muribaculaceae bacterium]|nr:UDP-N-acetylmuramate--L-alanine ligase [Muribaculaceae bacterium]
MDYKNLYFIGAGGIGMAALERYFLAEGYAVAGYDRTPSELTDALAAEGVEISFADDPASVPAPWRRHR